MTHHRTWFKVLLNPLFRKLGFSLVSVVHDGTVVGYRFRSYPKHCPVLK